MLSAHEMELDTICDRCEGCFYGLVVGDAFGAPVEFKRRDTFPPVTEMLPCGTWGLPAGSFTDDSSMMLCLAAAIVHAGGVQDPRTVLHHYAEWFTRGYLSVNGKCFDIGHATRVALMDFLTDGRLEAADDEDMSGNGSLMRLAPVPILWGMESPHSLWAEGEASSVTTHGSAQCRWACGFYATLLGRILNGENDKTILKQWILGLTDGTAPPALHRIVRGDFLTKNRDEISSSGYVVDTLEAALWAFFTTNTFEEGLRLIVNLGRDADTTGAVFGMLGGAYYGFRAIPQRWIDALQKPDMLAGVFRDLWTLAEPRWRFNDFPQITSKDTCATDEGLRGTDPQDAP